jgi:ribosomal protein S4
VDAGKAKAIEIAKQRAQQEQREIETKIEELIKQIESSDDFKAAKEAVMTDLNTQISGAKKKTKKTLQHTLELLEKRLQS